MRVLLPILFTATIASAAPQEFVSPATRTHLVELFTSEGCSSCPPAEAWLARLRNEPGLWRDFVPVAWHVDYWDRLGWKDPFASREATRRQYAYADAWRSASVYTPCFALNGREWRERNRRPPGVAPEMPGVLRACYEAGKLAVEFAPPEPGRYEVHAVLLAMGLRSNVTRGENRGRELHHDFVAATPLQRAPLRDRRAELTLPSPESGDARELALAVWVTRGDQLAPVQATGGLLADVSHSGSQ